MEASSVMFNGKSVRRISLNGGVLWEGGKEYEVLEYIEGTGTQWIDTEWKITDAGAILEYGCVWTESVAQQIVGSITPLGVTPIRRNMVANGLQYGNFYNPSNPKFEDIGVYYDIAHITNSNGAYYTSNGVETQRYTTYQAIGGQSIMVLRSEHSNSTRKGRIYYLRITDNSNGQVVRDMKCVRRFSDGVLGMYDSVTKRFFTNKGSGTFNPGPVTGKKI